VHNAPTCPWLRPVPALEEHVGVKLLSRSRQGVKVTGAGETLLAHARRVLRQLEQLSGDLQEYVSGVKGHVRVFANTTAMSEFLPAVLRTYLVNHPDVTIDMHERLRTSCARYRRGWWTSASLPATCVPKGWTLCDTGATAWSLPPR